MTDERLRKVIFGRMMEDIPDPAADSTTMNYVNGNQESIEFTYAANAGIIGELIYRLNKQEEQIKALTKK